MIVTKTPMRISFFGGGSDIPQFYEKNYGMVVSTTIDNYIYLAVNRCSTEHVRAVYSEMEVVEDVSELKHNRIREVLKHFGILSNIEICSFSDMTTRGTGLGSSSAFTVGLINAIYYLVYNKAASPEYLADVASYIEIDRCGEPIGKQDQYASSYGSLRSYEFSNFGVDTRLIDINSFTKYNLNQRLLCYSTGTNRLASTVLSDQVSKIDSKKSHESLTTMVDMAKLSIDLLKKGRLDDFGKLLGESWNLKKSLASGISNDSIDVMYERAVKAGALGGKILGAGGGGYLLVYCPENSISSVKEEMREYKELKFKFIDTGTSLELRD